MKLSTVARGLAATLLLSATAVFVACGDDDDDEPTATPTTQASAPSATVTTAPAESPTSAPASTATIPAATATAGSGDGPIGVAGLDAVANAVTGGDIPALVSLVRFTELACTTAQGAGGPPKCGGGEPSGTKVAVLPFSTCEGEYVREANISGLLTQLLRSPELHSAFELKDHGTDQFPRGDHGIVFSVADGGLMFGVDDDGRIVSLARGCALSADQLFEQEHGDEIHHESEHD